LTAKTQINDSKDNIGQCSGQIILGEAQTYIADSRNRPKIGQIRLSYFLDRILPTRRSIKPLYSTDQMVLPCLSSLADTGFKVEHRNPPGLSFLTPMLVFFTPILDI